MRPALMDGSSVVEQIKPAAERLGHKTAEVSNAVLKGLGLEIFTKNEKRELIVKAAAPALVVGTYLGAKFGPKFIKPFRH